MTCARTPTSKMSIHVVCNLLIYCYYYRKDNWAPTCYSWNPAQAESIFKACPTQYSDCFLSLATVILLACFARCLGVVHSLQVLGELFVKNATRVDDSEEDAVATERAHHHQPGPGTCVHRLILTANNFARAVIFLE